MSNILIISGHTDIKNSLANKTIIDSVKTAIPSVVIHYLDQLYPDFNINIKNEQQALTKADIIVLQFPIFWYNVPSLLARWIEEVWAFDFAYGPHGDKLKNKKLILSFTSGSSADFYKPTGLHKHSMDEFLVNLTQTVKLCGCELLPNIYTGGMSYVIKDDQVKWKSAQAKALAHAEELKKVLISLTKK